MKLAALRTRTDRDDVVFLLKDAETSPAMRRLSERGTPPSMRARNVLALRDYLNVL